MTALRNAGQVPMYNGQKNGSGYHGGKGMVLCKYVEGEKTPLAYFGEGLGYTEFSYSDFVVSEKTDSKGTVDVSCTVTNIGCVDREEVVQVYLTDEMSCMVRPAQELAGFYQVFLKAGESKEIHFAIKASQTAFLDKKMNWLVEAGMITVKAGSSSRNVRFSGEFEITETAVVDGKTRGFFAKAWETQKV